MRNWSIHNFRAFNSGISITITPLNITIIIRSVCTKKIGNKVSAYLADHIITMVDPQRSFNGYFMWLVDKTHFNYKEGVISPIYLRLTWRCSDEQMRTWYVLRRWTNWLHLRSWTQWIILEAQCLSKFHRGSWCTLLVFWLAKCGLVLRVTFEAGMSADIGHNAAARGLGNILMTVTRYINLPTGYFTKV